MERAGQTKKRQSDDGEDDCESKPRKRRSGNDTIEYLREKNESDKALRERELELKGLKIAEQAKRSQESQSQMTEMLQMMHQQQQQGQAMQSMILQQQQQQGKAMLSLIESLSKK